MTRLHSRRRILRWLGLGPLAGPFAAPFVLGACKIEPILDLPPPPDPESLEFPDLPPRIPEQLDDAEDLLRASLDAFLERETAYIDNELRRRLPEDPRTTAHLVALLRSFGFEAAGPRGGWLQDVELSLVEASSESPPRVIARPGRTDDPAEAIDLARHGAFRQRRPGPVEGLSLSPIRQLGEALPREAVAGRVILLEAPPELDLAASDAPARIDAIVALARESGALGCLVLTGFDDAALEPLRERWRRQYHPIGSSETDPLLIEGVLDAGGRDGLQAALVDDQPWLLDIDLGLHERRLTSHNVAARLPGRELPSEAAVLVCAWDTPSHDDEQLASHRLLASLGVLAQLADWQRRGTRPRRSLFALFAVDAGFGAGQLAHARWTATAGVQPTSVLAFDRVDPDSLHPALLLSGAFDARIAELAARVAKRDGRDLLFGNQLTLPSLAPYLRASIPVMTLGTPPVGVLVPASDADPTQGPRGGEQAGLHGEVRLTRNLLLALEEKVGPSPAANAAVPAPMPADDSQSPAPQQQ